MNNNDLKALRARADALDEAFLARLAERIHTVRKIGTWKKENHADITQKERERLVYANWVKHANDFDLDLKFLEKLFALVVEESKRVQEDIS